MAPAGGLCVRSLRACPNSPPRISKTRTPERAPHHPAGTRCIAGWAGGWSPFRRLRAARALPGRGHGRAQPMPRARRPVRRLPHGPDQPARPRGGRRAGNPGARRHDRDQAGPAALHPVPGRGRRHSRRPDGRQPRRPPAADRQCQPQGGADATHLATRIPQIAAETPRRPRAAGPARAPPPPPSWHACRPKPPRCRFMGVRPR